MTAISRKMKYSVALLLAGSLVMGPAMADKPDWAGSGKGAKHEQKDNAKGKRGERQVERRDDQGDRKSGHFEDRHRVMVRDYYGEQYRGRHCPPGLAKKNNGCMPPGQAKKWQVGRTLPREVIFYEVPQQLVLQIGPPPSGHRYVRVAGDILLIAVGTGMVIDAIRDLGAM